MKLLNCIPPWMSQLDNEDICYHEIHFKDAKQAKHVKSQIALFVRQSKYRETINFESECKLPCTQIHIDVQKIKRQSYFVEKINSLTILFEDSVKVRSLYLLINLFSTYPFPSRQSLF